MYFSSDVKCLWSVVLYNVLGLLDFINFCGVYFSLFCAYYTHTMSHFICILSLPLPLPLPPPPPPPLSLSVSLSLPPPLSLLLAGISTLDIRTRLRISEAELAIVQREVADLVTEKDQWEACARRYEDSWKFAVQVSHTHDFEEVCVMLMVLFTSLTSVCCVLLCISTYVNVILCPVF